MDAGQVRPRLRAGDFHPGASLWWSRAQSLSAQQGNGGNWARAMGIVRVKMPDLWYRGLGFCRSAASGSYVVDTCLPVLSAQD
jgi:hypothetical protein